MPNPKPTPLTILQLLELYPHLSETELMERMGIDASTVQRFVVVLKEAGVTVTVEQKGDTFYSLPSGKQLPPLMLRDAEIVAIVSALMYAEELVAGGNDSGTKTALAKLLRLLPARLLERVDSAKRSLEDAALFADEDEDEDEDEDYEDYYEARTPVNRYIATFTRAVQEHRQVWIRYYSWGNDEETKRTIDPYGLVQQKNKWYAVGYCHLRLDLRVFRLDNILEARLRAKTFEPPLSFDAVGFVAASLEKVSGS